MCCCGLRSMLRGPCLNAVPVRIKAGEQLADEEQVGQPTCLLRNLKQGDGTLFFGVKGLEFRGVCPNIFTFDP